MMTTILNLPVRQVEPAVVAVLSSWDTPRAQTYRELHDIPHDLGTAVTVQAMVFGNRDDHSGTGVAFSRNPNTGEHAPFGEVLFGRQGDDVVSGRSLTRPLHELADREPAVWAGLLDALHRVEDHYRDACYAGVHLRGGRLWLLQVRPGRFAGAAAVRVATDLADEGVIGRGEALLRVSPRQLRHVRTPASPRSTRPTCSPGGWAPVRASPSAGSRPPPTARPGWPRTARSSWSVRRPPRSTCTAWPPPPASSPPVAGRPATPPSSRGRWANRPSSGSPTSPSTSPAPRCAPAGGRVREGTLIAIDGTGGEVVVGSPRIVTTAAGPHLHRLLAWADEVSGGTPDRPEAERLAAAQAVLGHR